MDRQKKVRLLVAALSTAVFIAAVIMTVILRESRYAIPVPDITEQPPEYECVSRADAVFYFDALSGLQSSDTAAQSDMLDCSTFSTMLFDACIGLDIDYEEIVAILPERLINAKGGDEVALRDFIYVYDYLVEQARPENKAELFITRAETSVVYDENGAEFVWDGVKDYRDLFEEDEPDNDTHMAVEAQDFAVKGITAVCSENRILYISDVNTQPKTLLNLWLIEGKESEMQLFIGGVRCSIETMYKLPSELSSCVIDATIEDGRITGVMVKDKLISGKVLLVNDEKIELDGYGTIEFDDNFRMYKIYDELEMENSKKILVGYSITDFVISDNKICAALIKESLKADNIRVVLHDTGYKSLYHMEVSVTSNRKFIVERGGEEETYESGERVEFSIDSLKENERIRIYASSNKARFTIEGIKRASGVPSYRGSLEISRGSDGLVIVNELSLEEYLYAVIPSEMPTSYGIEALKVQAVCARSYAYNQLLANRYSAYGAHVDDSVNCQVYNNIAENEKSILAVKETYNEVMQGEDGIISAYYFSTSAGCTADITDVWEGGEDREYFKGRLQSDDELIAQSLDSVSFEDEKVFRDFIDNGTVNYYIDDKEYTTSVDTFDSDFDWYRWQVFLDVEDISVSLKSLYPSADIGELCEITVTKRGRSGIIRELNVVGTKSALTVAWQTNVRTLFAPGDAVIKRGADSDVSGMTLLPSAFCYFDAVYEDGELCGFTVRGGGYGHGCGMSQNGVKAMVSRGYTYDQIIAHYYRGSSITLLS